MLLSEGRGRLIDCGLTQCDTTTEFGCCDNISIDIFDYSCVESSLCNLKENNQAWLVMLICVALLAILLTLLCLLKKKIVKDRTNYLLQGNANFEHLDERLLM